MAKLIESIKTICPLATDFYIEIFDKKEAVLTGDFEVKELGNSVLKLKNSEHELIFTGKNLKISNYTADGIRINGDFEKIEFC